MAAADDRLSALAPEITINILLHLSPKDILTCRSVSKHFSYLSEDTQLWEAIFDHHIVQSHQSRVVLNRSAMSRAEIEQTCLFAQSIGSQGDRPGPQEPHTLLSQEQPMVVLNGDLELNHVRLVLGGQYIVGTHKGETGRQAYFKVWELPPPGLMSPPSEQMAAKLIATTTRTKDELLYSAVYTSPSNTNLLFQLSFLTSRGVVIFDVPRDLKTTPLSKPILPRTFVPIRQGLERYQDQQIETSPNCRFFWWEIRHFGTDKGRVVAIFDNRLGRTRHIQLEGLTGLYPGRLFIANEDTLISHERNYPSSPLGSIFMFRLPTLDDHANPDTEAITPVAHSGRFIDGWESSTHLLGESIILVALRKDSSIDYSSARLIEKGQVPFPPKEHGTQSIPRTYCVGQSSVLATSPSQLRFMWSPRWTERAFFLSINIDATLNSSQISSLLDIKRALPKALRTKPDECRSMTSTDAFTGRTAHLICPGASSRAGAEQLVHYEKEIHVYESFYGDHP
ncbi:hypothetical protein DL96DRAFT_1561869 [Flagelloscypha sp. PMI_526]|nr:hypothetical protein DL96DRAFT_1561869 [Flagelloscypha sp. PMI_526]